MGRRHQEGRARHPGGPNRHGPRPSGSQPIRDARPPTPDAPPPAPSPGVAAPIAPDFPSPTPMPSPGEELLQAGRVRPAPPNGDVAAAESPGPIGSPASPALAVSSPRAGATPAQLRRFIKSRPYVPLHELRRRFGLNGHDDDVVALQLDAGRIFVGLPPDEGRMLGELIRQGEVGCELSLDPSTPVVIGVFPIRPVVLGRTARAPSAVVETA